VYLAVAIVLIVLVVIGLALTVAYLQSSNDAVRKYDALCRYTEENGIEAVRLVDRGLGIVDSELNPPMEAGLQVFSQVYTAAGDDPSAVDLEALREELAPSVPGDLDLYVIDTDGVLRYSTVPDVLGLDFSRQPFFFSRLTGIREGDTFAPNRVVRSSESQSDINASGRLRKFAYLPSPDHRYVLELGVQSPDFSDVRSRFSFADTVRILLLHNPDLTAVRVVDIYGNIVAGDETGTIAGAEVMDVFARRASTTIDSLTSTTSRRLVFVDLREPAAATDNSVVMELDFDRARIDGVLQQLLAMYLSIGLVAVLLGVGLSLGLSRYIGSSVGAVMEDADRIAGGDLDHAVRGMNTTEFIALGRSINTMVGRIRDYSEEIERKESELRIAAEIQTAFLPRTVPTLATCEIAAFTRPTKEVGGDFYDFFGQGDGQHALVIADVSGKGVPAALYMALLRTTVRTVARWCRIASEIISRSNDSMVEDAGSISFVTLFYSVIDEQALTLTYVNAGHNPPILRRASGALETLEPTGPLIGYQEEMAFEEVTVQLGPGDLPVLYTDGVTEAENDALEMFGEERLEEVIAASADLSASACADAIREAVNRFTGDAPQSDDITVIVVRVLGQR
jgi:serine phosphatase RsbU (regulator of sigma subunit)